MCSELIRPLSTVVAVPRRAGRRGSDGAFRAVIARFGTARHEVLAARVNPTEKNGLRPLDFSTIGVYTPIMDMHRADPVFSDCRRCACAALRRASRAVTKHYERSFRGSGLRATQFSLLAVLTQTGPLPVSRLAAQAGVERTTLTRNLQLLQAKGLVRVRPADRDQRVRRAELTPTGLSAARKALPAWRKAQSGLASILQTYDVENLLNDSHN
jgi:DNA-binding MarR family transcriptional regulator